MAETIYLLVQWEDRFLSIIQTKDIVRPKKDGKLYYEGELIEAVFQKKTYHAVICEINTNRKYILQQSKLPPKYNYHEAKEKLMKDNTFNCETTAGVSENEIPLCTWSPPRPVEKMADSRPQSTSTQNTESEGVGENEIPLCTWSPPRPVEKMAEGRPQLTSTQNTESERVSENEIPLCTWSPPRPVEKMADSRPQLTSTLKKCSEGSSSSEKDKDTRTYTWEDECRSLRRKIRKLEDRVAALEKQPSRDDHEMSNYDHISDPQEYLVKVTKTIFNEIELKSHSRTGKKTAKCLTEPRPALDKAKMMKLESIVRTKTGMSKELFYKKFENLQKVLRRKQNN
ncbi:uncharacterized protein LOC132722603 isoform X1 [Ruditapes philippinarum]|uniref:uncharacterized protein LOC132722603 isoform X1 n=1 Tax=Ruditapes philippinarum TaxID=129788 RepID=UPI00295AB8A9|nr:uncharacterized protein LOC132722603 isoform X1 [Ruditapes philippinarum]